RIDGVPDRCRRGEADRMTAGHLVRTAAEAEFETAPAWAADSAGYARWSAVDEAAGAVHTGFGICVLDPGGSVPAHIHSFEGSFYVEEGSGVRETSEGSFEVVAGDYGLIPVGVPHQWRNTGDRPVRWAEMQGPVPRARYHDDTLRVPDLPLGSPHA